MKKDEEIFQNASNKGSFVYSSSENNAVENAVDASSSDEEKPTANDVVNSKRGRGKRSIKNPVESLIGKTIRDIRVSRGLSQIDISVNLGITFQQFQKYESGANRVSVSRLIDICKFCKIPLSQFFKFFFDNVGGSISTANALNEDSVSFDFEPAAEGCGSSNKEILSLVKFFSNIKSPEIRTRLSSLVKEISKHDN